MQRTAMSGWLPSPRNMHLNVLSVFSWLENSDLLSADQYSIIRGHLRLFIHHLRKVISAGCCQVGAVLKTAAVNILVQTFLFTLL